MLKIQINNPDLEKSIKQTYGNDMASIEKDFSTFLHQQQIKQDIGVSIEQLDEGMAISLVDAINDVKAPYE